MEVTIRNATLVRPAQETPKRVLRTSDIDLIMRRMHTFSIYLYRSDGNNNFFSLELMKAALARALVPFYPVAGRLQKDANGRIEIICNGEGVLLVEAEVDAVIDDSENIAPALMVSKLAPQVEVTRDIGSCPLLVLQLSFFRCGGVSLGVGLHHVVGDGESRLHFINTWADMARGLGVAVAPFLDRAVLRARDSPAPKFSHIEYQPAPSLKTQERRNSFVDIVPANGKATAAPVDQVLPDIFRVTHEQLEILISNSMDSETGERLSRFQALASHIWTCISNALKLSDDQETKLYISTDGRARLTPRLPKGYFGNVQFKTALVATVGELKKSRRYGANLIRKALDRMDDEYLRSVLDYLHLHQDLNELARTHSRVYEPPNLLIVSWARLPVHRADFGWGSPIFMGPVNFPVNGPVFILPNRSRYGDLSVCVRLDPETKADFEQLFYDF